MSELASPSSLPVAPASPQPRLSGYKTILAAVGMPIMTALLPGVAEWISTNPEAASAFVGLIMLGLRMVTKRPIAGLSEPTPFVIAPQQQQQAQPAAPGKPASDGVTG